MKNFSTALRYPNPTDSAAIATQFAMTPTNSHSHTGADSPRIQISDLSGRTVFNTTWGTGGNTATVTNPRIATTSIFTPWVRGTVPANGRWAWTISKGQVVITSSDSESASLTISYTLQ